MSFATKATFCFCSPTAFITISIRGSSERLPQTLVSQEVKGGERKRGEGEAEEQKKIKAKIEEKREKRR